MNIMNILTTRFIYRLYAYTCFFVLALICMSASAHAQIVVDGIVRSFKPGARPIENVPVKNVSENETFKVGVEVYAVQQDEQGVETKVLTKDIRVAPAQFILGPSGERTVRLMLLKPSSKDIERAYRISFLPEKPPAQLDGQKAVIRSNVNLVTTMGMYVTVAPEKMEPKLTFERDAEGITFTNEGNVSIDMKRRQELCFDSAETECISLPGKRILPKKNWMFKIVGDRPIQYYYEVYGDIKSIEIPPYSEW